MPVHKSCRFITTRQGHRLAVWPPARSHPGLPCVVMLHGLGVDHTYPLISSIATHSEKIGYPVARFDFTGHGRSGGTINDRRVSRFISDGSLVLDYLRKEYNVHKVILVGHSIGALTSIYLASRRKKMVAGIVLIGCNSDSTSKYRSMVESGQIKSYQRYDQIGDTKVSKAFWKERRHLRIDDAIKRVTVPTLIICGSEDRVNPPRESRQLYRWSASKYKRFSSIPSARHDFASTQQKNLVNEHLGRWLTRMYLSD